jgi:histidinol-phosphate/aromatic aminotransferase/cobyric acid decarboxylase-like protein
MNRPNHGGNLLWAATLAGCPPSFILDFSASINPLGPPQLLLKAIQENLGAIVHYPDPSYQRLCLALAQEHQVPPDHVLPGNGAAELITWAARELAQLDWVGVVTPAFSDYGRSLSAFHAKIKEFPLELPLPAATSFDPPQPPLKRGENQLSPSFVGIVCLENIGKFRDGEKAGLLLNNPHNPTGKLWRREEILPYLESFALVVVDEAFMDFLPPEEEQSLISLVQDYPNLVIIRSLTKFYSMPGLRLGYASPIPKD